jgi:DNA polymerase-3 subunit gamma/tau
MLGISGDLRIRELANHIIARDISGGLKVINAVSSEGLDLRQFNRELVDYLRHLLLVKSGSTEMVDATSDDLAEMQKLAGAAGLDYLLAAVKLFSGIDLRMDSYSPLPLELALVETVLSQNLREKGHSSDANGGRDWPSSRPAAAATRTSTQVSAARQAVPPAGKPPRVAEHTPGTADTAAPTYAAPPPEQPHLTEPLKMDDPADLGYLRGHWKDFINSMRGEGSQGNLDARLRHACEPVEINDGTLVLGFYHKFHMEYINNRKYLHLIEKKLLDVFGHNYTVSCVMVQTEKKPEAPPVDPDHLVNTVIQKYGGRIAGEGAATEEK